VLVPPLPPWARYKGEAARSSSWIELGHRLIVPAYDHAGRLRSLRAWRTVDGATPKRLPPGGYRASEVVLANPEALTWLRHSDDLPFGPPPMTLGIVEGEPDYLQRATMNPEAAILGILSGSWSKTFADKIPSHSEIIVRTHCDRAGDHYADLIMQSLSKRMVHLHRVTLETIRAHETAP